MTAARKIISLLIIIFLGLPALFGVIWVVGLTKASVSPEFVSDLPREIIADIPDLANEIFQEAQDENVISDENTRAWFQAVAKAGVTPKEFMAQIGLLDWLENELSESLEEVGEVLRGERRPRKIVFDLRPLKNILLREDIDLYLMRILENLPPCNAEEERAWLQAAEWDRGMEGLPACRPDLEIAKEVMHYGKFEAVEEMPEEFEILEDVHFLPFGVSRTIILFSYFLFLFPAFFIFIGALIAATSPASFFRWSGVSVFIGGLPALILSFFAKEISLWAIRFAPYSRTEEWSTELSDLVLEKLSWIPMTIVDHLFSPVIVVAGVVCIVGVVLFALSFIVRGRILKETESVSPTQTPKVEPPEEKEKTVEPAG